MSKVIGARLLPRLRSTGVRARRDGQAKTGSGQGFRDCLKRDDG